MPGACASSSYQFDAIQMYFTSGSAGKGALFEELDNEKILLPVVGGTLPFHRVNTGSNPAGDANLFNNLELWLSTGYGTGAVTTVRTLSSGPV